MTGPTKEAMQLAGYAGMGGDGFVLPLYRRADPISNAYYVAIAEIDGDRTAPIARFEAIEEAASDLLQEPRTVCVGDFWHDVFVWQEQAFAGTPSEIYAALSPHLASVSVTAPLCFLDLCLALSPPPPETAHVADLAHRLLSDVVGEIGADRSFGEAVLRRRISIALHRSLPTNIQTSIELAAGEFRIESMGARTYSLVLAAVTFDWLVTHRRLEQFTEALTSFFEVVGATVQLPSSREPVDRDVAAIVSRHNESPDSDPSASGTGVRSTDGAARPTSVQASSDRGGREGQLRKIVRPGPLFSFSVPAARAGYSADKILYLEQRSSESRRLLRDPLSENEMTNLVQSNAQNYFFVDHRGINSHVLEGNREAILRAIGERLPNGPSRPRRDEVRQLGKPRQMIDLFGALRLNDVLKSADLGSPANEIIEDANLRNGLPDASLVRSLRVVHKRRFDDLRRRYGISKNDLRDAMKIPKAYGRNMAEQIANHFCRVEHSRGSIYDIAAFTVTDATARIVVDALIAAGASEGLSMDEVFPLDTELNRRRRIVPLRPEWGNLI